MSLPADVKQKHNHGYHYHGHSGGGAAGASGGQQNKKPKIEGQSHSAELVRLSSSCNEGDAATVIEA